MKKLTELKRMDMIDRTIDLSSARYKRRLNYKAKISHKTGPQELYQTGNFSLLFDIGDYKDIIEIRGLREFLKSDLKSTKRSDIKNSLIRALDQLDLGVFCTCADFYYRFHYLVSAQNSIPSGAPMQTIPAVIRNPENRGFLCKHLSAILASPSSWIPKAVTLLRESILYQIERGEDYVELDT